MVNWEKVPIELRERRQWFCWAYEDRGAPKPTKVPKTIGGYDASSTNPGDWYPFEEVVEAAEKFSGIGFVFSADDPLLGIDLDDCLLGGGEIAPWAADILDRFDGTYAEISPSGKGVKIFCTGEKPAGARSQAKVDGGQIECYSEGRFFTVTANVWDDSPVTNQQPAIDWLAEKYLQRPVPVAPAPTSYTLWQRGLSYVAKAEPAAEGNRNNQAFRLAGHLAAIEGDCGERLSGDQVLALARQWNVVNSPPLVDEELEKAVASAMRNGSPREAKGPQAKPQEHPGVNISGIVAPPSDPACDDPDESGLIDDPGDFPKHLITPPGMIGDLAGWTVRSAIKPQPIYALAGAVALAATIYGRKVQDELGTRTNLYVVAIGGTGSGKNRPRETNAKLLLESGAEKHLGREEIASSSGLIKDLEIRKSALYQLDEFGLVLEAIANPMRGSQYVGLVKSLLQLWSASSTLYRGAAYADGRDNSINQPHCVVFGTATPGTFLDSLSSKNVEDGLMNRMLMFESPDRYPEERDEIASGAIPGDVIDAVRWWANFAPGGNLSSENPEPQVLPLSAEARSRLKEHRKAITRRQRQESDGRAALWSRTAEKSAKLALVHACSRRWIEPQEITGEDVEWGIGVSNYLTRRMCYLAQEHVSESPAEKNLKRIIRAIRKAGGEITQRNLTRSVQGMSRREREDALVTLSEAERIVQEIREPSGRGRPAVVFKLVR